MLSITHVENNGELANNEEGTKEKQQHLFTNFKFLTKLRCCVRGRVKRENFTLSNELTKVELSPGKIWEDDVSIVSPSPYPLTKHLLTVYQMAATPWS